MKFNHMAHNTKYFKKPLIYFLKSVLVLPVLLFITSDTMALKSQISNSLNIFTKNLLKNIDNDSNFLISPLSAHVALCMVYEGTDGETANIFLQTLNLSDSKTTASHYNPYITILNNVSHVALQIVNKIYIKSNLHLQSTFKTVIEKDYLSNVDEIDFENKEKAVETINKWVQNKTNNKINTVIEEDSLDASTLLLLLNVVYFCGQWKSVFDKNLTEKKPFYLLNTKIKMVDMMSIKGTFNYKENENMDCKILEMPYQGNEFSLIVFLPNKKDGIIKLLDKVADFNFSNGLKETSTYDVHVEFPKFKIETTVHLKDILSKMGFENIFSNNANFSKISSESLKVSEVIQKTFIEVNEKGTEAAAASAVIMRKKRSLAKLDSVEFIVNRPFLLAIVCKRTDVVLFLGRVLSLGHETHEEL